MPKTRYNILKIALFSSFLINKRKNGMRKAQVFVAQKLFVFEFYTMYIT